ncbi:hypothetical protein MXB_2275 [Myxobolus squamalis]|nr:hypothetical protein MXB_2275 [Myxobolus squamalis]
MDKTNSKEDQYLIEQAFYWISSIFSYITTIACERLIFTSLNASFSNIGYYSLLNLISLSLVDLYFPDRGIKEDICIFERPCTNFLQVYKNHIFLL